MKQRTDRNRKEDTSPTPKASVYNDEDFAHFDKKPSPSAISEAPSMATPASKEPAKRNYREPDKQFRRNITLSEEQFRKLEFIKKMKNKARSKDEELVTLDKLMFDMVQHCLDTQYPEASIMFEKYIKLKEMEDFADLM